ncbi:hypothetical protein [Litorihabitans aurantiacus]|nr:hypothetical protein [Litorihabitans aurantiacus]
MALNLDVEPLRRRPTRQEIAQVRRDAAAGTFGPGQDGAVEVHGKARSNALAAAAIVGGVFALTSLVIAFADPDLFSMSIWVGLFFVVLVAGGIFLGTSVQRARRWRRHATMAAFARANGMTLRLVASGEEVPPSILEGKGSSPKVVHHDVVTRVDEAGHLVVGTRVRQVSERRSTNEGSYSIDVPHHLVWAALRPVHEITPRQQGVARREIGDLGQVRARIKDSWVVVSVEHKKDPLDRLPELLIHLGRAAAALERERGPQDAL